MYALCTLIHYVILYDEQQIPVFAVHIRGSCKYFAEGQDVVMDDVKFQKSIDFN